MSMFSERFVAKKCAASWTKRKLSHMSYLWIASKCVAHTVCLRLLYLKVHLERACFVVCAPSVGINVRQKPFPLISWEHIRPWSLSRLHHEVYELIRLCVGAYLPLGNSYVNSFRNWLGCKFTKYHFYYTLVNKHIKTH